jgi:hypothetical protein
MPDTRRADPAARRAAITWLGLATLVGAGLIAAAERYRAPLRDWLLADPDAAARRAPLIFWLLAGVLLVQLLGFAAYFWSRGARMRRFRECPLPGTRVIRDTPVLTGDAAASRGRLMQVLAIACVVGAVVLGLLLWRLAALTFAQ